MQFQALRYFNMKMLDPKSFLPALHTGFFFRFYPKSKVGRACPAPSTILLSSKTRGALPLLSRSPESRAHYEAEPNKGDISASSLWWERKTHLALRHHCPNHEYNFEYKYKCKHNQKYKQDKSDIQLGAKNTSPPLIRRPPITPTPLHRVQEKPGAAVICRQKNPRMG